MKIRLFKNLYDYRELLKTNVKKEIRGKYKASFLGILWTFLNPLLQILVYAIVFPYIMKNSEPNYIAFLACGIFPWTWFTASISQGTQSIRSQAGIVKKVYFPREILPISTVTAGFVNFMIESTVILLLILIAKIPITAYFLLFPLIAVVQYFFTLGLVLITGACEVYVHDLEYIINFLISLAFYITPILFSADRMADSPFAWVFEVNPLATIMTNYRNVFIYQTPPNFLELAKVLLISLALCCVGIAVFRKLEKGFAEEL